MASGPSWAEPTVALGEDRGPTLAGRLSRPGLLAAVRDEPGGLLPAVADEGLRWVSPIGAQTRQAVTGTGLAGGPVPAGAAVGPLMSSASRDETRFENAQVLDSRRPPRVPRPGGPRHLHVTLG